MNLTDLKFEQVVMLLAVILVLLGFYNAAMTAWKNHLEAKKRNNAPVDELTAQLKDHARMLDSDKRRFEDYDRQFSDIYKRFDEIDERLSVMKKESSMTLRGVRALMSHEINGNSIDRLTENANKIDEYLIDKEG